LGRKGKRIPSKGRNFENNVTILKKNLTKRSKVQVNLGANGRGKCSLGRPRQRSLRETKGLGRPHRLKRGKTKRKRHVFTYNSVTQSRNATCRVGKGKNDLGTVDQSKKKKKSRRRREKKTVSSYRERQKRDPWANEGIRKGGGNVTKRKR